MSFEDVVYEVDDGLATITINRPKVMNAFRAQTVDEMVEAFKDAWGNRSIGVEILTGAGDRAFCTGGDQSVREGGGYKGKPSRSDIGLDVEDLHSILRDIPKPVIAAVNGYAIGGGHVLHVICDLSIAADTARFGQVGPKVGSDAHGRSARLGQGDARDEPDGAEDRQGLVQYGYRAHPRDERTRHERARSLLPDRRGDGGPQLVHGAA